MGARRHGCSVLDAAQEIIAALGALDADSGCVGLRLVRHCLCERRRPNLCELLRRARRRHEEAGCAQDPESLTEQFLQLNSGGAIDRMQLVHCAVGELEGAVNENTARTTLPT